MKVVTQKSQGVLSLKSRQAEKLKTSLHQLCVKCIWKLQIIDGLKTQELKLLVIFYWFWHIFSQQYNNKAIEQECLIGSGFFLNNI